MRRLLLSGLFTAGALALAVAQAPAAADAPADLAVAHARALAGFSESDLLGLAVSDSYTDERFGVTYVYLEQRVGALPIDRVGASVAVKDGRVYSFRENFEHDVRARLTNVTASLNDERAVRAAAAAIGFRQNLKLVPSTEGVLARGHRRYATAGDLLANDIAVDDVIAVDAATGQLRRAIAVELDVRAGDFRRVTVDAATGAVLAHENLTHHCRFEEGFAGHAHVDACAETVADRASAAASSSASLSDGASYNVYAWPAESPSHGPQVIVSDPSDVEASPYGWHDIDGQDGPEYTITRGNNAHAFIDAEDDDAPSTAEPDGGEELAFDYPYDELEEPFSQTDATTVNLFYAVNRFHDFIWHYGFDEEAGNFQENNYGRGGRGRDAVSAQSQDGSLTNAAGNGPAADFLNNANFSTPGDGGSGRMQMYLWDADNSLNPLQVSAPAALAGRNYGTLGLPGDGWGDGAVVDSTTDVSGGVVFARDNVANASFTDGCEAYADDIDVEGKIAVIDRGTCEFGTKASIAQEAGAVGVVICNFEDNVAGMLGGTDGPDVNIPVFMMSLPECLRLRQNLAEFPDLTLAIRAPDTDNTDFVPGSLDNGIVAHEYGHGVSTRLTGGPSTGCLVRRDNTGAALATEQMGEGWSDFYALVTSVRPGDTAEDPRGIGTYSQREPNDGPGIRPFPYSRDMDVNPVTYGDVANSSTFSAPHGVGSIWASMIWDLHWDLVDEFGFGALDTDTLGNNKAIQLVTTGLKLQPCYPGFVDGRDAILAADELLYGGRHRDLIWRTFARRGLGARADQGDPDNRSDQTEDFTLPLDLLDEVIFEKAVTENIEPGGEVTVELLVANYLQSGTQPAVELSDVLPEGATLVGGSVTGGAFVQAGDVLTFTFDDVERGDSIAVAYRYTAPDAASDLYWYEPIADEFAIEDFEVYNNVQSAAGSWDFTEDGFGDRGAFVYEGVANGGQPLVELFDERPVVVGGGNPHFSFYHRYDVNTDVEGAIVQVRRIDEEAWTSFRQEDFVRNGYTTQVPYRAFVIPLIEGFGPKQDEYVQSVIDLSAYAGETILLRWRFGREDDLDAAVGVGGGWTLDELAQIDAVTYNTTATLDIGGEVTTATAPGIGTLVAYGNQVINSTADIAPALRFEAFPNPTSDKLSLRFDVAGGAGEVEVLSVTGQVVTRQALSAGQVRAELDLASATPGVYAVRVSREGETRVVRVTRQ